MKRTRLEWGDSTPGWSGSEGLVAGTESWSQEVKFRGREVSWMSSREVGGLEMRSWGGTWGQAVKGLEYQMKVWDFIPRQWEVLEGF